MRPTVLRRPESTHHISLAAPSPPFCVLPNRPVLPLARRSHLYLVLLIISACSTAAFFLVPPIPRSSSAAAPAPPSAAADEPASGSKAGQGCQRLGASMMTILKLLASLDVVLFMLTFVF